MESVRRELLEGVWLTAVRDDRFKTGCLSVSLLNQLERETAAHSALIPCVLRRGSRYHTDMQAVGTWLDELYGCRIIPAVRKFGEIQSVGFLSSFADERCLPSGESVFDGAVKMLCELLLSPCTKGGLLLPEYVESEKEKLLDKIRGQINDKRSYALRRLIELMCCYEDFAVSRYGSEDAAESIHYRKLTKRYRELIMTSPIELFYCGSLSADEVADTLADALCVMPRGAVNYNIGTDIRMNSVEEKPREYDEELSVTQGKLALGWRLGACMEEPDMASIMVFNAVFGGGVTSKLFMNVRERLGLCYYASSAVDTHKGLLTVSSGVDFDKFDDARAEIEAQLDAMRRGDISPEELASAKSSVASYLRGVCDTGLSLESFYLSNTIDGLDVSPEELASEVEYVDAEAVAEIARGVVPDAVYRLHGGKEDGDEAQAL